MRIVWATLLYFLTNMERTRVRLTYLSLKTTNRPARPAANDPEVEQLKRDVAPEVVLQEIEETEDEVEEAAEQATA